MTYKDRGQRPDACEVQPFDRTNMEEGAPCLVAFRDMGTQQSAPVWSFFLPPKKSRVPHVSRFSRRGYPTAGTRGAFFPSPKEKWVPHSSRVLCAKGGKQ